MRMSQFVLIIIIITIIITIFIIIIYMDVLTKIIDKIYFYMNKFSVHKRKGDSSVLQYLRKSSSLSCTNIPVYILIHAILDVMLIYDYLVPYHPCI